MPAVLFFPMSCHGFCQAAFTLMVVGGVIRTAAAFYSVPFGGGYAQTLNHIAQSRRVSLSPSFGPHSHLVRSHVSLWSTLHRNLNNTDINALIDEVSGAVPETDSTTMNEEELTADQIRDLEYMEKAIELAQSKCVHFACWKICSYSNYFSSNCANHCSLLLLYYLAVNHE